MQFLTTGTKLARSILNESGINTPWVTAADLEGEASESLAFTMPNLVKVPNAGLVGGIPYNTNVSNDYWTHSLLTITNRANPIQMAKHLKRHAAGPVTSTAVVGSAGVFDHTFSVLSLDADPQLAGSTYIVKYGGLYFLLYSMISNNFSLNHANGQPPRFTDELVGTGGFKWVDEIAGFGGVVPNMSPDQKYFGSAMVRLQLNDGALKNITALGRYVSYALTASNNLITDDRQGGDPIQVKTGGDITNPEQGAYVRQLLRNVPTHGVQVRITVNENRDEFMNHWNNTVVQSLAFLQTGPKIGATVSNYECELITPRSIIETHQPDDANNKALVALNFMPLWDEPGGESGLWKVRIRNGSATLA